MKEKLGKGRANVKLGFNTISMEIPAKKNWFMIIFTSAWMGGWFIGEVSAILGLKSSLFSGKVDSFLLFWLIGWTIAGVVVFKQLIWQFVGKEQIKFENDLLTIGNSFFGLGINKEYEVLHIKNLTVHDIGNDEFNYFGFGNVSQSAFGRLKFDYGYNTIRFARDVDEAEARVLCDQLKQYLKIDRSHGTRSKELQKQF